MLLILKEKFQMFQIQDCVNDGFFGENAAKLCNDCEYIVKHSIVGLWRIKILGIELNM